MIKLKKKVSVIMPFFRKKKFFREAYNSILNQNYRNIEIIIIYDDHNLSELDFVESVIDKKNTIVLINKKNRGAAYSRNLGIKKSEEKKTSDIWELTNSNNSTVIVKNLKKFCEDNMLNISCMKDLRRGRQKSHKGWVKLVNLTNRYKESRYN
jgi:glycosyltransferase involved in cell wall biosynthesis